ncbi:hypothetical protein AGMMS49521_0080 [Campylobacterota bacterium]|nr:hypothetical protein AGMMS49521_0080 [Campylobacterota bacterium]
MFLVRFSAMLFLTCAASHAGWAIEETTKYAGGDIFVSRASIDSNRYKTQSNGEALIINLKNGTIYFVHDRKKSYYGGSLTTVINALNGAKMSEMSGEDILADTHPLIDENEPAVTVIKTGEKLNQAGFNAEKYQVLSSGELRKELFLAQKITVNSEIDSRALAEVMLHLSGVNNPNPQKFIELSDEYVNLLKNGYPIRTLEYDPSGDLILTEVTAAAKQTFTNDDFLPPKEYKKLTTAEFLEQ